MEGTFRRRRLPHWDRPGATYFVTTCLAASLSDRSLAELRSYRRRLKARPPSKEISQAEAERRMSKLVFRRFDDLLDRRPQALNLAIPEAADVVRNALYHFAADRYDLLAYVVMPSHFHWVFTPTSNAGERRTSRELIMHSIKSYTANVCNDLLRREGKFWQDESYDHVVRDDEELVRIIRYVEHNPVKAGLIDAAAHWRWSSARDRVERDVPVGHPLSPYP